MEKNKKLSIVIFYHRGPHDDDVDTIECADGLEESFQRLGYKVKKVHVTKNNWRKVLHTAGDVFFNLVEDDSWELYLKIGRELSGLHKAQVGHDLQSFRYAISKTAVKQKMKQSDIRTPQFQIFRDKSINYRDTLNYPLILKPANQHAGIGISQHSIVTNKKELFKQLRAVRKTYPGDVVVEEFIQGREIHVTIMGNDNQLNVLPFCEISFNGKFSKKWCAYTYKAKWDEGSWEYWDAHVHAPALLTTQLKTKIKNLTTKAYKKFNCRDIARFDVRVDQKDRPYIVDINMNPSLNYYDKEDATLASVYARRWSYDEFIQKLTHITYQRIHPD